MAQERGPEKPSRGLFSHWNSQACPGGDGSGWACRHRSLCSLCGFYWSEWTHASSDDGLCDLLIWVTQWEQPACGPADENETCSLWYSNNTGHTVIKKKKLDEHRKTLLLQYVLRVRSCIFYDKNNLWDCLIQDLSHFGSRSTVGNSSILQPTQ